MWFAFDLNPNECDRNSMAGIRMRSNWIAVDFIVIDIWHTNKWKMIGFHMSIYTTQRKSHIEIGRGVRASVFLSLANILHLVSIRRAIDVAIIFIANSHNFEALFSLTLFHCSIFDAVKARLGFTVDSSILHVIWMQIDPQSHKICATFEENIRGELKRFRSSYAYHISSCAIGPRSDFGSFAPCALSRLHFGWGKCALNGIFALWHCIFPYGRRLIRSQIFASIERQRFGALARNALQLSQSHRAPTSGKCGNFDIF